MWTLVKTVKINFFRTLKNHQRFATIQVAVIQEEWLDLSKNSEFCGFLTCAHHPLPSSSVALGTNRLTTTVSVKNNSQVATERRKWVQSFPEAPFPDNCHYLPCLAKLHFQGLSLFDLIRVCFLWRALPTVYLLNTISGNCLISQLPEDILTVGANKRLTKVFKKNNWLIRCP